jgi:hypothetical protein
MKIVLRKNLKKKKLLLFIDWGYALKYFTISSYDEDITSRQIDDGCYTCWFNIDNVKREIENYSEKNNFKLDEKKLKVFLKSIEVKGLSYSDKNKLEIQTDIEERNKQGIKIKMIE